MTIQVVSKAQCGNSPKNLLVEHLAIALASGDDAALERLAEHVVWNVVGTTVYHGHAEIIDALQRQRIAEPVRITLQHVVTHGKAGAANGTVGYANGRNEAFCAVVEFTNAKGSQVVRIDSYLVAL